MKGLGSAFLCAEGRGHRFGNQFDYMVRKPALVPGSQSLFMLMMSIHAKDFA